MEAPARGRRLVFAIVAGVGAALAPAIAATFYWDVRCRGADELCALAYAVWLIRSLLAGPFLGAGLAALLSPPGAARRAALVTLGVSGALLWSLLGVGHFAWKWPFIL